MMSMVGTSLPMRELMESIDLAARTDSTVLIHGETGTGKELVAQAIHSASRRLSGPFIPLNCSALTESIEESELFGHEKGAFTGAFSDKKGQFELATGGTLFLDEVAELSLSAQAKLLRALQQQEIRRVGGARQIPIDVRFVSATHCDLWSAVDAGAFREDLYYRLNVILIRTPALRQRREDIPLLAQHFIEKYARNAGCAARRISKEAESALCEYDWPGNVRQLENAIQRAIAYAKGDEVKKPDLPILSESSPAKESDPQTYHGAIRQAGRRAIAHAFVLTNGQYKPAAHLLHLDPKNLHKLLKRLNLSHLLR